MYAMLVCLCVCADDAALPAKPIPLNFREYFERGPALRANAIKFYEARITQIQRADNPTFFRKDLKQMEQKLLDATAKTRMEVFLPPKPKIGEIGAMHAEVFSVIDGKTAIVRTSYPLGALAGNDPEDRFGGEWLVVMTGIDTTPLKTRQIIDGPDLWMVTSLKTDDAATLRMLTRDAPYYVVEPIQKPEIEKYQNQYESEDPKSRVPANVREYFKRADVARAKAVKTLETQISDLEIAVRSESNSTRKAVFRRQLKQTENAFDDLKRTIAIAYLPGVPQSNVIGFLDAATVIAAIDDRTAIVQGTSGYVILSQIDSKPLKERQTYSSSNLWKVVSTSTTDEKILKRLRLRPEETYCIVEPIKKVEIEKYRAQYEAEKKAATVKPAK